MKKQTPDKKYPDQEPIASTFSQNYSSETQKIIHDFLSEYNIQPVIILKTEDLRLPRFIIESNLAMCELLGYNCKELYNRTLYDIVPEKEYKKLYNQINSLKEKYVSTYDLHLLKKNKTLVPTIATSFVISSSPNNYIEVVMFKEIKDNVKNAINKQLIERKKDSLQNKYLKTMDCLPIPTVYINNKLTITNANKEFLSLSGYKSNESIISKEITDFIADIDNNDFRYLFETLYDDNLTSKKEIEVLFKDRTNNERYMLMHLSSNNGFFIVSFTDIDYLKTVQNALSISESKYRTIFNSAYEMILIHGMNDSRQPTNYIEVNKCAIEKLGYTESELLGMKPENLFMEDKGFINTLLNDLKPPNKQTFESKIRKADGSTISASVITTAFTLKNEKMILTLIKDRTKIKQTIDELKKSEEKYRSIIENAQDMIMIQDVTNSTFQGRIIEFNSKTIELLKYSRNELNQSSIMNYVSEKHLEIFREIKPKLVKEKKVQFETTLVAKSGKKIPVTVHATLCTLTNQSVILFTLHDISKQKRAQENLKKSEKHFRVLTENAKDVIYRLLKTPYLHFDYVSPSVSRVLGYKPHFIIQNNLAIFDVVHPADHKHIYDLLQLPEITADRLELRLQTKNGDIIYTEHSIRQIKNQAGDFIGIEGIFRDITNRIKTEKSLQKKEKYYRNLLNNINEMVFITIFRDGKELFVDMNSVLCDEIGFARKDLLNQEIDTIIDNELVEKHKKSLDRILTHVDGYSTFKIKNGGYIHVEITKTAITYGNNDAFFYSATNINHKIFMLKTILNNEERFRVLFENINDAIFIHTLEGQFLEVNKTACERLGYTREELLQMTPKDIDTQTYAEIYDKRVETLVNRKSSMVFETVHINKEEKKIPTEINAKVIDYLGNEVILSVARDITKRKQIENEFKETHLKFKTIFDNTKFMVLLGKLDIDPFHTKFLEVNSRTLEILGYEEEYFIDKPLYDILRSEDLIKLVPSIYNSLLKSGNYSFNTKLKTVNDTSIWCDCNISLYLMNNEEYILITLQDITDKQENIKRNDLLQDALQIINRDLNLQELVNEISYRLDSVYMPDILNINIFEDWALAHGINPSKVTTSLIHTGFYNKLKQKVSENTSTVNDSYFTDFGSFILHEEKEIHMNNKTICFSSQLFKENYSTVFLIPIFGNGLLGFIEMGFKKSHTLQNMDINLLEKITSFLGNAVVKIEKQKENKIEQYLYNFIVDLNNLFEREYILTDVFNYIINRLEKIFGLYYKIKVLIEYQGKRYGGKEGINPIYEQIQPIQCDGEKIGKIALFYENLGQKKEIKRLFTKNKNLLKVISACIIHHINILKDE